jgi:hypothetical protein
MKSLLLKRKTKCQLCNTIILPAVFNGSERWTLRKAHEALFGGFEKKIRIYEQYKLMGSGEDIPIRNYVVFLMMLIQLKNK